MGDEMSKQLSTLGKYLLSIYNRNQRTVRWHNMTNYVFSRNTRMKRIMYPILMELLTRFCDIRANIT